MRSTEGSGSGTSPSERARERRARTIEPRRGAAACCLAAGTAGCAYAKWPHGVGRVFFQPSFLSQREKVIHPDGTVAKLFDSTTGPTTASRSRHTHAARVARLRIEAHTSHDVPRCRARRPCASRLRPRDEPLGASSCRQVFGRPPVPVRRDGRRVRPPRVRRAGERPRRRRGRDHHEVLPHQAGDRRQERRVSGDDRR